MREPKEPYIDGIDLDDNLKLKKSEMPLKKTTSELKTSESFFKKPIVTRTETIKRTKIEKVINIIDDFKFFLPLVCNFLVSLVGFLFITQNTVFSQELLLMFSVVYIVSLIFIFTKIIKIIKLRTKKDLRDYTKILTKNIDNFKDFKDENIELKNNEYEIIMTVTKPQNKDKPNKNVK
jgi:hypothetical protein